MTLSSLPPELQERIRRLCVRLWASDVLLETARSRDDFIDAFDEASLVCREVVDVLRHLPQDFTDEDVRRMFDVCLTEAKLKNTDN